MLVSQILNAKPAAGVITIGPQMSVADAARLLSEKRIGAVVVSEEGAPIEGILSERDIVRELGRRGAACLEDRVSALMTRRPVTCAPGDSDFAVLEVMTSGRFRHLPVVDGAEMVGLISIGDVVKARLAELAMENQALEGMIMGH